MSVKRYEWVACDEHSCHCDVVESTEGDMVDYEDYAVLEQKLAESQREFRAADATIENMQMQVEKLAAENAGLKEWSPNPHSASMFEAIEKAEKLMDDGMPELAMIEAFEILKMKRTPETDAFLAEVRAQGVEMFAASLKVAGGGEHPYSAVANEFAAQLRKGVQ